MIVKHFKSLDAFRGICACLVALFHFKSNSVIHNVFIFQNASIYVDFFFALSGFVIFANYEERLKNGYKIGKFILLRFGRLWPLHISILSAFILVDILQLFVDVGDAAQYKPFSAPGEGIEVIIANIFMVHSLNLFDQLSLNGPSWSISVEFYTYIIFASILCLFKNYALKIFIGLSVISALTLYHLNGSLYATYNFGLLRCIFGFSFGVFSWKLYCASLPTMKNILAHKTAANVAEFSLIIAFTLALYYMNDGYRTSIFPLFFALFILIFAHDAGALSNFLNKKYFQILGILSYSIYMIHIFISGKFFALPIRVIEQKTDISLTITGDNGKDLYGHTLLQGTLIEMAYLIIVIAASYVSYKIIEDPARKFTKKLANKIYPKD